MSYIIDNMHYKDLFIKRHYPKETKARIIPYYVVNNRVYFLMCEEKYKKEYVKGIYNILGGHRENMETIIECAKRELAEETLNVLELNDNGLTNEFIIKKNKRYIIFLPVYNAIKNIIPEFELHKFLLNNQMYNKKMYNIIKQTETLECLSEIKSLKWISEYDIYNKNVYRSVKDIFETIISDKNEQISCYEFLNKLKKLYNSTKASI